jgi:hypothetical protein
MLLSCRRARRALRLGAIQHLVPGRFALPALILATILGISSMELAVNLGVVSRRLWGEVLLPLLAFGVGALFLLAVRWAKRPAGALGAEAAMLTALAAGYAAVGAGARLDIRSR